MQHCRGNRQAAARLLGLKRTTLVARLRRRDSDADTDDGEL
jgi:DNA-binding protein Fis